MADTSWREIRANFSGANQAMAGASQSMSQAGDIFSKMRAQIAAERQSNLENEFKERQLAEQIRQFDVTDTRTEAKDMRDYLAGRADQSWQERDAAIKNMLEGGKITDTLHAETKEAIGVGLGGTTPTGTLPVIDTSSTMGRAQPYINDINRIAKTNGIDPNLMIAMIDQESKFNPNAVNPTSGATGMAQFINDDIARSYGVNDRTDPIQSLEGMGRFLGELNKKYKGDVEGIVAGYNWGQGNYDAFLAGKRPMPNETSKYSENVRSFLNSVNPASSTGPPTSEQTRLDQINKQAQLQEISNMPGNTPNTLGLQNKAGIENEALRRQGHDPGPKRLEAERKEAETIQTAQTKEDRRLWSNDAQFRAVAESNGDMEDARARYENEYIKTFGEKPDTNPFDRAVEIQTRDRAEQAKLDANDKAAIENRHSLLSSDYTKFLKEQVKEGKQFSYDTNVTRATIGRMLGDSGERKKEEEALKGSLVRTIYRMDTGDKSGFFPWDTQNTQYSTAWFGINDESAAALDEFANFDPATQSYDQMSPLVRAMYDDAVKNKLIPKEVQDQIASNTKNERDARTAKQALDDAATAEGLKKEREARSSKLDTKLADINKANTLAEREKKLTRLMDAEYSRIAGSSGLLTAKGERVSEGMPRKDVAMFETNTKAKLDMLERRVNEIRKEKKINSGDAATQALREMRETYGISSRK